MPSTAWYVREILPADLLILTASRPVRGIVHFQRFGRRFALHPEFLQTRWDDTVRREAVALLRLAIREDLGQWGDVTSKALVPKQAVGAAAVVARQSGVVAGLPVAELAVRLVDPALTWRSHTTDGCEVVPGEPIAQLAGPARSILAAERIVLNVLGRLSGVATLTRRYVEAVAGTRARIYDTRKTTPGWRRLEKYAVRIGGGHNHRTGLFDAILIKDNHLALGRQATLGRKGFSPAQAVRLARHWASRQTRKSRTPCIVEIEADTLDGLDEIFLAQPDIVLLDNMSPLQLRRAVARRDACNPQVELEASGGVNLRNVRAVAETGVDRISVGALTHAATALDFALDWLSDQPDAPA